MLGELASLSGASFETVMRHEVSKILETSMKLTKVAKAGLIRTRFKTTRFVTMNGRVYYLGNLYPDALWAAIQEMRRDSLARKLKARGLARQSWWRLGLGVEAFEAPTFIKDALASNGRVYLENTKVIVEGRRKRLTIEIENSQPTALIREVGGERVLQQAMRRRMSFFYQNLNRRVFDNMSTIAMKYPGFTTR